MAANREAQRAAEARYKARVRARKTLGDYDWVVVLRVYNGQEVSRELTSPEKLELSRLVLRAGGLIKDHADRMGYPAEKLERMVWHYSPKARAIGLDIPIRHCFLSEELTAI